MKKAFVFCLAVLSAASPIFVCAETKTKDCNAIDADFERTGKIVLSRVISGDKSMRGQSIDSPEYLDGMLDALPNDGNGYLYGDTLPTSIRITINPDDGLTVRSKLPDGTESTSLRHTMDCSNGFWAISKGIFAGNEKMTAKYTLIIDQMRDGNLRVQRLLNSEPRDDVPKGAFYVMAHFRKISP